MEPFQDPASTREEILGATYRALCRHGYADLTVQKIGAEFDKSPSLVYHHYDGKDALLLACLEYVIDSYEAQFADQAIEAPRKRLEETFGALLDPDVPVERQRVTRSLAELRGQTANDERYREHFTRSDRFFRSWLAALIEAGIEAGESRDVDPQGVAATLQAFVVGWFLQRATADGDGGLEDDRAEFDAFVQARLYAARDAA